MATGGRGDRAEALLAHLAQECPVQALEHRTRRALAERRGPERVACQPGDRCRGGPLAADVADRDRPRAVARLERVVEVAADLRALTGRVIDRRDLGVRDVGQRRRKERSLESPRDLIAVLIQAGGVDGGRGAPGQLDCEREV